MKSFDHIYRIHRRLRSARYPVSFSQLQEELGGCSKSTLKRHLRELREELGAPIQTVRDPLRYCYGDEAYELPGLWFGAAELHALLSLQHLLGTFQPGLLDEALAPLRTRLAEILRSQGLDAAPLSRIRLLNLGARPPGEYLGVVAKAVLRRQCLEIRYQARSTDQLSERQISPQRLIHYRANWYLDAWCHKSEALRTFSVDRIVAPKVVDRLARDCVETELDAELGSTYGIFAGQPRYWAVLRFSPARADWIEGEIWHPQQHSQRLDDRRLELRIPYHRDEELILDILRYGPDVEVVAPPELRSKVAQRLRQAMERYSDTR